MAKSADLYPSWIERLFLRRYLARIERSIDEATFDRQLSGRIDCLTVLLQEPER